MIIRKILINSPNIIQKACNSIHITNFRFDLQRFYQYLGANRAHDFNKLPAADHIASFFNVSYQYAEATDSGLHQRIILKY